MNVALRKESVDRNSIALASFRAYTMSLSARRAWIEMSGGKIKDFVYLVALRKESVDRNYIIKITGIAPRRSLSARRAWIEIVAL